MRIISGTSKGKKLYEPKDLFTRPLKDLTKESIFNIITHSNKFSVALEGANILDLFSGTGSFGLECLSRDSKHVTFVENYLKILPILKKNIIELNYQKNSEIIEKDINKNLNFKIFQNKFDIIFLDPPYKEKKLFEILDKEEDLKDSSNIIKGQNLKSGIDSIQWDCVSLKYPDASGFALENFSAKVNRGETIAIVGPSGGGKTSLINLLIRAIDPSSGSVRLNNVPIWHKDEASWKISEVRSMFSLVTQDPVIFQASVSDNISLGDSNPDKKKIAMAAAAAQAMEFIDVLPGGLSCILKEGGTSLSGGQKQRIALARAMYRDSDVLLLDEATSALDTENEARIQKALDAAAINRTTIIVAHRLATIQKADRILVVDQGKLVESGKHSELISRSGLYSQLVKTQTFAD